MEKIAHEKQLLKKLYTDIESLKQNTITILAGHFPLRIDQKTQLAYEDIALWGDFSTYTFELGCKIGKQAKDQKKNVQFIFICDDIMYQEEDKQIFQKEIQLSERQLDRKLSVARKKFYQQHSGPKASIHPVYEKILEQYGFGIDDVIRQNQNKNEREDCVYFSEIILKNAPEANTDALQRVNTCSRAYVALLESDQLHTDQEIPYLISFVPNKCSHYVCDAVDFFIKDFTGTHVFMETFDTPQKKHLFERGVYYKKDAGLNKKMPLK